MTMPSQRTRAQVQTRDFQVELAQDAMLSAPIRPVVTGRSRPLAAGQHWLKMDDCCLSLRCNPLHAVVASIG
jgi:hypothetical protein